METIVIRSWDKRNYGDTFYVEFCVETREYCTGHVGTDWGHGTTLLIVEAKSKKEVKEKISNLVGRGYAEIGSFAKSQYKC